MRLVASAIGPVLTLAVVSVPAIPAHAQTAEATRTQVVQTSARTSSGSATTDLRHRRSRGIGLDSTSLGTKYVSVSWNWIKAASGYRVQLAKNSDFSAVVTTRKKGNSLHRPAGGRLATVLSSLHDATYYWVRVRKVSGGTAGRWSAPIRVATKAITPNRFDGVKGVVGSTAGQTTIRWTQDGAHVDFYRITTAITPFGGPSHPAVGRHSTTFKVPGDQQSVTLTPEQTTAAGAGIGTGRFLFYRISAVRRGEADSASRAYPFLMHIGVAGQDSTGLGTKLRFLAYNMHVASKDEPGHPWKDRQHLIAANIAGANPAVAGIEELMPGMWTSNDGGVGLDAALQQAGAGKYEITRTTPYWSGNGQDTHILYDPTQVDLVSTCPETVPSCYISLPDPIKVHVAAYALFRDRQSQQEFYFISAHLSAGNDATTDALRGRQAQAISDGIAAINNHNLPVVIATDANSSQTSIGADSPHQTWLDDGWYNTLSAGTVVNGQYNSVNHYQANKPSPWGYGSMYDTIMTLNMPSGADLWKQVLDNVASDHNMVFTDLNLPLP
jgi:endonuclease/exonuclease/phosphatase family metal-dependent hydrolase